MGLVQNLQLLIINVVCWLPWLSSVALAQLEVSEGISGFVDIHVVGLTFLANLAVSVTSMIRGRLDLEIGARDVLDILASPKLKPINGIKDGDGLTTCRKDRQTASTERVRLPEMGEFFRRLRQLPQKMGKFFRQLPQKMGEFFRQLRHRLAINIPCFRGEEDLQTASEEGRLQTASTEGEGRLQTVSNENNVSVQTASTEGEVRLQIASNENGSVQTASTEGEGRLQTTSTVEIVLQTASVVMLSNGKPNLSIREFMKSNAPIVDSILLRFRPLQDAINDREVVPPEVTVETCGCNSCNCIVFRTVEELTIMLVLRMPGTLKQLSNSLCLLPCLTCLTNGCHGCNGDSLLRVEGPLPLEQADEEHRLRVSEPKVVSKILDDIPTWSINAKDHICICIPMNNASRDDWTKLLLRSLRSKDAESRGVRVLASEALEGYLAGGRGGNEGTVEYNISSFIVPRLTEVLINLVLTFWFRVDGFSSSLAARRTIREYLVDSKGSGFAANAFLTKAVVKSDFNNTQVCQVLIFRGDLLGIKTLSFIVGCVNLICSVGWAVLIGYEAHISPLPSKPGFEADISPLPSKPGFEADISPLPSKPGLAVIIAAVGIALCMDSAIVFSRLTSISPYLYLALILSTLIYLLPGLNEYSHYYLFVICGLFIALPSLNLKHKIFLFIGICLGLSLHLPPLEYVLSDLEIYPSGIFVLVLVLPWLSLKEKTFLVISYCFILSMTTVFKLATLSYYPWDICVLVFVLPWLNLEQKIFFMMIILEMFCLVMGCLLLAGSQKFGRWVYSVLQVLVWVKWTSGSYILTKENSLEFFGKSPHGWGNLVYSSAFFLNAVLAGVRCKWGAWPWSSSWSSLKWHH